MRPPARAATLGALACLLLAAASAPATAGAVSGPRASGAIVDKRVSFSVRNINRSMLRCHANGEPATIIGRLVGPRSIVTAPDRPATVTLYLHEFSFGKWFWHFSDPAYDYATKQARAGHVSVLVDRLGYGESSHPHGNGTCLGADADEDHQMVSQLRAGTYELAGLPARGFDHVVLAGHSGGAMAAEIEAYSFGGIDALIVFAHADQGFSARGTAEGLRQGLTCALGGEPAEPGGPGGYAYFGATPAAWRRDYFQGAEARIVDAAVPLRYRDPCGDVYSFPPGALLNVQHLREIKVPVLLLYGLSDTLFDQPSAGKSQRRLFSGSSDVTLAFFAGSGHALTLERCAPALRHRVSGWLDRRGLG